MNKIIKSGGYIEFAAESGYESEEIWPLMDGNASLVAMLDDLGRILTINGEAELARKTLEEAIQRTEADLAA